MLGGQVAKGTVHCLVAFVLKYHSRAQNLMGTNYLVNMTAQRGVVSHILLIA